MATSLPIIQFVTSDISLEHRHLSRLLFPTLLLTRHNLKSGVRFLFGGLRSLLRYLTPPTTAFTLTGIHRRREPRS